jgi:hypothetical protein
LSPGSACPRSRAAELDVESSFGSVEGDSADSGSLGDGLDLVSCVGATWVGGGLLGTLELMRGRARSGDWLVLGEGFWAAGPLDPVRQACGTAGSGADLAGTLERFESAGFDLLEVLLASTDDWDRYQDWVAVHPDDPDAGEVAKMTEKWRRSYLADLRRRTGRGVFVLRDRTVR